MQNLKQQPPTQNNSTVLYNLFLDCTTGSMGTIDGEGGLARVRVRGDWVVCGSRCGECRGIRGGCCLTRE